MGAVPAVKVEGELDQGTLDRDEMDTGERNGQARACVAPVRGPNRNRCMLVGKRGQSHEPEQGQARCRIRAVDLARFLGDFRGSADLIAACFRAAPLRLSENRHSAADEDDRR